MKQSEPAESGVSAKPNLLSTVSTSENAEASVGRSEHTGSARPFPFFVYIIESPSAPDIYHARTEGGRVAEVLRLDGIPCTTRIAINLQAFQAALRLGLPEAMRTMPGRYPVIHLSSHGASRGIELSSGEFITWKELRAMLVPINQTLNGVLLLCMSACEGYNACQMAMEIGDAPHPYFMMVGNFGSPTWSDTAVSYLAFYHLLAKGRSVPEAVEAMRAASGRDDWTCETAVESRRGYIEFLKNDKTPREAQARLESIAKLDPPSAQAKALETDGEFLYG